jgi:hypothetical protein
VTDESEILRVFERRNAGALFVTELQSGVGPAASPEFDAALDRLARRGEIVIVTKSAPDPHLADVDLRIAAPVASGRPRPEAESSAVAATEAAWRDWLRDFLSTHRCR